MSYGLSFLVPTERLSLTKEESYKQAAIAKGIETMMGLSLAVNQDNLVVRLIRAFDDLAVGTILENEWRFNLAAGANAGAITSAALPANRIIVFYGIDDFDANPQASVVTFRTAAAGGTTKMMVDLQTCRGYTYCAGLLAEPVVYGPQETVIVDINSDAISATEQIVFNGYVIEPRGQVIS